MSAFFNDWLTRRFMAVGGKINLALKYHWAGDDALVGGLWVDRVSGLGWTAYNNPVHNADHYVCGKDVGYLTMNLNAASPAGLRIGQYWRMEVDFEVDSLDNTLAILDFGSLQNARHAFGLLNASPYNTISDNYKPFANDVTYAVTATLDTALSVGTRKTISFGCEKIDSTNDVQYIEIDGVKTYGTPHAQTSFVANFNAVTGYIGRGMLTAYCGGSIKIYSLKIYTVNGQ